MRYKDFVVLPEHVENRPLFNHSDEQVGVISMWVDMFPADIFPLPKAVNICPRTPVLYELRIVIYNVSDVICKAKFPHLYFDIEVLSLG